MGRRRRNPWAPILQWEMTMKRKGQTTQGHTFTLSLGCSAKSQSQFPLKSNIYCMMTYPRVISIPRLTHAGMIKWRQFGAIHFASAIKERQGFTQLLFFKLSILAHLVSHLSSFHPREVNSGCDAGVWTRADEKACRLIPAHHKGESTSPHLTFLRQTPVAHISGQHCSEGTRGPPPTNNSLPSLTTEKDKIMQNYNIELQYSLIRAIIGGTG